MARGRIQWRRAWPVALGIAMSLGDIPEEAFRALTYDPEEAEFEYQRYLAQRKLSEL